MKRIDNEKTLQLSSLLPFQKLDYIKNQSRQTGRQNTREEITIQKAKN